ncbi:MAG TPA: hypothetical protein VHM20_07340 [Gammaproteobacteria bacterium]|jgi:hypothetical protein|nr:hypothetical protein [Gammaproteobacteria bacterium]
MNKKICLCLLASVVCSASFSLTGIINSDNHIYHNPFYMGVTFAYGATTWGYLIADDQNAAMNLSTPTRVRESGEEWGIVAGYEFLPTFGLEFSYDHYPRAKVTFDSMSIFTFEHDGLTSFYTDTESLSLSGKYMVLIPHNENFRAFASAGVAYVHRTDIIADKFIWSPKFGVGGNFAMNEFMGIEFGLDYTAGNGVSEMNPAEDFIPFLYSVYTRLILRF